MPGSEDSTNYRTHRVYQAAKKDVARPSRPDEVVKNGTLKECSAHRDGVHSFIQKNTPGWGCRPVAQGKRSATLGK